MPCTSRGRNGGPLRVSALLRKTIEQPVTAGGQEIGRAAAARHMGRAPGTLKDGILGAGPVDVTEHGAAEGAAGPVVAGQVHVSGKRPAFHVRPRERVVPVRREPDSGYDLASLGQ